ncbi:MAG: isocitrate dehydrogenase kinase/phosphatase AceK regulatory subunit, partial [Steroidobacteraceae bacterium]
MRLMYPEPASGSTTITAAARPQTTDSTVAHAFESALYGMRCAQMVVEAFLNYNARFREITRRAAERFAAQDWIGMQQDAVARIELYERFMLSTVSELELALADKVRDRLLWADVKRHFT